MKTITVIVCFALLTLAGTCPLFAQSTLRGEAISIARISEKITMDGDLSDPAWRSATRIDKWYETNPGDNIEPAVKNVGYLAYDDRFFYAAFDFQDPDPSAVRAPFNDRDNVPGYTDYGGVILDTRNDGHSAMMFLANPRGIQYDAITDDASGEDSSPDFFWESAARINERGWSLEIRIPFSSLRYQRMDPLTWGIMLYRNYPRDFRHQFFSAKLPRGGNCFICRSNDLTGLEKLPSGGHLVAAPYVTASERSQPRGDLGTPLTYEPVKPRAGLDLKWTPNADNAIDLTVKPDFSQVESDTAQISANERFALFFPEKRPFFLEGVELLSTPIQAVYTRTITSPKWGGRATGKQAGIGYTVLVADDTGGGSVLIPGTNGSSFAPQDFSSRVVIARARREIGRSFVSMLVTDRESRDGGHNRVFGPDFQWRPVKSEVITGQFLVSRTKTPNRPDLESSWTGGKLASNAGVLQWGHNTTHLDLNASYKDFGDGFRADTGFVPQVGYRDMYAEQGYTFRPKGFLSRLRAFLIEDRQVDHQGALISREVSPGAGMDTRLNGFMRFRYANDRLRSGSSTFGRQQFVYTVSFSPHRIIPQISADGFVGQEIDFANSRPGRGGTINLNASLLPTSHLELRLLQAERRLAVRDQTGVRRHLFTADVSRVRATYTFTARTFARFIGQYVSTRRDPSLYTSTISAHSGTFNSSALFAYKLNWQSVLFVGYGDDREISDQDRFEKAGRQFFVKVSYALQR